MNPGVLRLVLLPTAPLPGNAIESVAAAKVAANGGLSIWGFNWN